jgi:haloalkane dehalogenase
MAWADEKKRVSVDGSQMAYVERGSGDPIVFLHGNPTSSYLWRNVLPHLERQGRCLAPDLIGMGDSDKLEPSGSDRYRFVEHRRYLDGLLEALGVRSDVTLVVHDWGSALGFDWARRHPEAVRGIAFMEALVAPSPGPLPEPFPSLRSPAGEKLILEQNLFIEQILPGGMLGELAPEDHDEYRRPYRKPGESRRPTLTWPREIPVAGEPADVTEIVGDYGAWLADSELPKLFINGEPGAILTEGPPVELVRSWPNVTETTVPGLHFLQEDSPDEIGSAIAKWHSELG